jgi:LuxR family maltose regulon positive regulatory protein
MTRRLILQTKLQTPQLKRKILHRKRLLDELSDNLNKKLILVCADAGYGKTTLLVQLCQTLGKPFVFYELDVKDNDTATFFDYLVNGIRKYDMSFGKRVQSIIPQTRNSEIIIGTFVNEFIEKFKEHFYIILDDYHHLQQNKEIAKHLDYLLRHLPTNLHLIISSSATPPLPLPYYASKQELFTIEKDHLQFNLEELRILLRNIYKLRIPEQEIVRIAEHSAGWITAVQLILQKICAAGEDKTGETLNRYLASGEEVFNYFAQEVFKHLSKRIQEFLIQTSILEFFSSEICKSLFKMRQSKKIISSLENEHIFVSRLGEKFRYHPLFHEFLGKKLSDYYPGKTIAKLHLRAGNYFFFNKRLLFDSSSLPPGRKIF